MDLTSHRTRTASAALIGVLTLALFYPALRWLVSEWLGNDYYSHGPLVPLISAVLAWRLWVKRPASYAGRGAAGDENVTQASLGPVSLARPGMERGGSVRDRPQQGERGGSVRDRPQQGERGGSVRDRPQQGERGGSVRDRPQQGERGGSVGDRPQQEVGDRPQQVEGAIFKTVSLILLLLSLAGYLYALQQRAYFAAVLAMILMIAGLLWYLLGTAALRRLAFPIGFLLFMVPLPFVEPFSVPLAQFTGVCAAWTVRLFGVPIKVNGAQVTLPTTDASTGLSTSLVVGAQCSGLRSIVALLTLVALVVFLVKGPWWGKLLLALSSIPIAIIGNVLRVASLLVVANVWGAQVGFKYYHDYSSPVFFVSALALLLLFSRWVRCREIRDDIF
jgi:exosortase